MRKFSRETDQRQAFMKSLAANLIKKEKIKTTEPRAKELRSFVERAITRAKKDNVANRRLLSRRFSSKIIKKLFQELGPRYRSRAGGYTKITKIIPRKSDGAKMAVIELIK